jgi:hypothetical protein
MAGWHFAGYTSLEASAGKVVNEDGSTFLVGTCVSLTELQLLSENGSKHMQREHALCQQLVDSRQRSPMRRVSLAALGSQKDLFPWQLGKCFAQVMTAKAKS